MKHHELGLGSQVCAEETSARPGAEAAFDCDGLGECLSSLKPRIVIVLAAVGAAVSLGFAALQLLSSGQLPWLWLPPGAVLAFIALAGFVEWKCVRCGADHYVVSDLFKSETIPFDDVCMVVEAPGFIWNSVCIHLRRPSRFGWAVTFVPRQTAGQAASRTEQRLRQARQGAGPNFLQDNQNQK